MEGIDNNWDELLHDSFQYSADTLGHPEGINGLQAYDFELGSQFWGSQAVQCAPPPFLTPFSAEMTLSPFSARLEHFLLFSHIRQNRAIHHQRSRMTTCTRQTS